MNGSFEDATTGLTKAGTNRWCCLVRQAASAIIVTCRTCKFVNRPIAICLAGKGGRKMVHSPFSIFQSFIFVYKFADFNVIVISVPIRL